MAAPILEQAVSRFDQILRTVAGVPDYRHGRPDPADVTEPAQPGPGPDEARHAGRLMRVNYAGEVAAQGLYIGQGLSARSPEVAEKMDQASREEQDHLNWCLGRMQANGVPPSRLNPVWMLGSLAVGAAAGAAGDRWSLGFVAETERQVMHHLQSHLRRMPETDPQSRAVVEQMYLDERGHAEWAEEAGGAALPLPVRYAMTASSKLLTVGAYWV